MSEKTDNPPAFPRDERYLGHNGMTLRDYFAGQAMVALAASVFEGAARANMTQEFAQNSLIEGVYKLADAMLKERAK